MNTRPSTNVLLIWPGHKKIDVNLVNSMVKNGLKIIEYRPYLNQTKASIIQALIELKKIVQIVLVNNEVSVIKYCDGVWVGEHDMVIPKIKQLSDFSNHMLIGKTVKSLDQLDFAIRNKANMIGVGAVFESPTKQNASLSHWDLIQNIVNKFPKPAYLIGGLNLSNLNIFLESCYIKDLRIAVSSAVFQSKSPVQSFVDLNDFVTEYRKKINKKT